jgi:hypothetical protein
MLIIFSLLSFMITSPLLADSEPRIATRALPWPCEEARSKAQKYFSERKIEAYVGKMDLRGLIPGETACVNCLVLHFYGGKYGPRALDSHGKTIGGTFSVLWRYTARPRLQPRAYSDLDADGVMFLKEAGEGCSASLVFRFTVVKHPFIPIIDGESAEFESNGRLEAEYLDAISKNSK